jgi:hypothetical protein
MPLTTRSRIRAPFEPKLDLPPPFRQVMLREVGDAFAHATAHAAELGAGTLVFVGRFDLVEFAVVLEPDEPLRGARRVLYAGLAALGDALASHAPPEKPITIEWPDAIHVDGGLVGGVRLGWPVGAKETEPAPWLVFGAMIRTVAMSDREPGLRPIGSALEEEGFDDLASGALVESFARHLMLTIDGWQESGFRVVAESCLARVPAQPGVERLIDGAGDYLVRRAGMPVEKHRLIEALATPSWCDPQTGAPRT